MKSIASTVLVSLPLALLAPPSGVSFAAAPCGDRVRSTTVVRQSAGRLDWSRTNGLVVYDRPHGWLGNRHIDVFVMTPGGNVNGSDDVCLTCDRPGLERNNGNPAWHPSGEWIVFQSQIAGGQASDFAANPGRGLDNVLWLTNRTGTAFFQLTWPPPPVPPATEAVIGVLHPHFSADGRWLSWSEMVAPSDLGGSGQVAGYWNLKMAELILDNGPPHLGPNITDELTTDGFYENHGFTPDGGLLFSSNFQRAGYFDSLNNDIFSVDVDTWAWTRLTTSDYNEHASFFPSGDKILWMSDREITGRGTELWTMDPDGSEKERLTFLDVAGCRPAGIGNEPIVADSSINAAGDGIMAFVQAALLAGSGPIVLVELTSPL
jgi:Tol biopolymer transport system component